MRGPTSRTATALVGHPSAHQSGAATPMTAGSRAEVHRKMSVDRVRLQLN